MTNTTTFKAGKSYTMLFIGDSDLKVPVKVLKRTKKTVTVKIHGDDAKRIKIHTDEIGEYIYPEGTYSMCPRAHSKRIID